MHTYLCNTSRTLPEILQLMNYIQIGVSEQKVLGLFLVADDITKLAYPLHSFLFKADTRKQ